MKRYSTLLLLVILIVACKEVSYKEPQPRGMKPLAQVPSKLQGNYQFADEKGQVDTIVITKRGFYAKNEPKDFYALSDTLVMKSYRDHFFISKNEHPEWVLRIIKQEKNGDVAYLYMEYGDNFPAFLEKLSHDIPIDSLEVNGEKLYQIDPSSRELMELISKGYFKKVILKKVN
jgi:hypothetical protein